MVGISYGEPEKGAQFLLESNYADQTFALWKSLEEKGYIVNTDDARENIYPLFWYRSTHTTQIVEEENISLAGMEDNTRASIVICPLQKQLHSFCRCWDESRYSFLIPKNQKDPSPAFKLLKDIILDPTLVDSILSSDIASFWRSLFPLTSSADLRTSAKETLIPADAGFVYTPSDSSLLQKGIGYAFNGNRFSYSDIGIFTLETSEDWLRFDEQLENLKAMYHEEGIDEMIAEANEQLAQFRSVP